MEGATFTDTIMLLHLGRLPSPGERRLLYRISTKGMPALLAVP